MVVATIIVLSLLFPFIVGGPLATEYLYPNFTATNTLFIDNGGAFLQSKNATFHAAVHNPGGQQSSFYLVLIHAATNTIVWSANRNSPISSSGAIDLTPSGLTVTPNNTAKAVFSTPPLPSPVTALRLLDSGNLLLLGNTNQTLWQSFDHPTDTILSGQRLPAGASLVSAASATNLSDGDYRLTVTASDAVLQWAVTNETYWALSGDVRSDKDYNAAVDHLAANATGLYLFSNGGKAVFSVPLPVAGLRIMSLDSAGRFTVADFVAPSVDCELPFNCRTLGLCTRRTQSSTCTCPSQFRVDPQAGGGCLPADASAALASCAANANATGAASYTSLGSGVGYFANRFAAPVSSGESMAACRARCTDDCSCSAFFYKSSSRSCYLIDHQLGSLTATDGESSLGFIKTLSLGPPSKATPAARRPTGKLRMVAVLLPSIAALLLVGVLISVGFMWRWRTERQRFGKGIQLGRQISRDAAGEVYGSDDDEEIEIPGLPARFSYTELEAATDGFATKIGSGGFGEVYKGTLPDKTVVAVKRIGSGGAAHQGRREFLTEIAVIGNVRHVNLVRLRGFCAEGSRRLLVYEFMNLGSLDRSLFGQGPALEWGERVAVAVGAARGLAYLHGGCDRRIVHCDVKPENILLHGGGGVKIADFGLAKLISPEQSGLFTTMRGTRGYIAPEWLTNSAISDKTDVYSYGMVLLELVRGRKNRSCESEAAAESGWEVAVGGGGGYFPAVALEMHKRGQYMALADPRLEGRVAEKEVGRVVRVALCCLHEEPAARPSMAAVAGMLEGATEVWEPRVESLGFLRLYGRGTATTTATAASAGGAGVGERFSITSSAATTSGSGSYRSSQQVSGPR